MAVFPQALERPPWRGRRLLGEILLLLLAIPSSSEARNDPWTVVARQAPTLAGPPGVHRRATRPIEKRPTRPSEVGAAFQTIEGGATDCRFGHAVAGAGDVNGDGFADVLVGAFGAGDPSSGQIFLYQGSARGITTNAAWQYTCPIPASEFGHQVEGVGDVNGDHFDDFIAGATYYSRPGQPRRTGGAFVFHGSRTGPGAAPDWELLGEESESSTGFSVAAAGDVNGDGFADVLVGAWNQTNRWVTGPSTHGRVSLFLGGPRGLGKHSAWTPRGERTGSRFGYAMHGIGDVNGDGFADVAVGSWGYEGERMNCGRVYVYYGNRNGLLEEPDWTATGNSGDAFLGNSVFGAGDVDADGYADLLVAANSASHPEKSEGIVAVFRGSPNGLETTAAWTFEVNQALFFLGHSVATAGDLNADGYSDVVVSAYNGTQDTFDEGVVFMFLGGKDGPSRSPDWTFCGGQARGGYGSTVRSAGDVNGDGFDDLIVGHTYFSGGIPRQGRAWIHYGSPAGLKRSSGWGRGIEAAGFTYLNLTVPWPNPPWFLGVGSLLTVLLVLATRAHYRRQACRDALLRNTREIAQREERDRLAQDLHDRLGADLTDIVLATANARRGLGSHDLAGTLANRLGRIEAEASQLVSSLAEIVWLTKPIHDRLGSLAAYLGNLVAKTLENTEFGCELSIPMTLPDIEVAHALRHDLVLAVREALSNAIRHSGGNLVHFQLALSGNRLEIAVSDNGQGFPIGPHPVGNGLTHLVSRLDRHGGTTRIEPSSNGTRVCFSVPI